MDSNVHMDPKPPSKYWDVSWPSPWMHNLKSDFKKLIGLTSLKLALYSPQTCQNKDNCVHFRAKNWR